MILRALKLFADLRVLTAAICLPVLIAALAPVSADLAELYASRAERILAFFFFLGAVHAFFSRKAAEPAEKISAMWLFLPALVVFLHSLQYLWHARAALFLADQDITNISSAIANTARGQGLLQTAYVQTGDSGSYLGHHFAPALLLFAPFYFLFPGADHSLYPFLICLTLGAGLLVWTLVFRDRMKTSADLWPLFLPALLSVPVFRLSQSFHNEVFVILFAGAAVLGLGRGKPWLFLSGILLWALVKEDTAAYAGLFCFFAAWIVPRNDPTAPRKLALTGLLVAVAAGIAGRMIQTALAGSSGPDWSSFMRPGWPDGGQSFAGARISALMLVLGSFGFLPILRLRYATLVIVPVAILHAASYHPWHATYYGHYAYSILPLLMAGTAEAARKVEGWTWRRSFALLVCALALYTNASDKKTPGAPMAADNEFASAVAAARRIEALPPSACIHAQSHLSPVLPAGRTVLPLFAPPGNPHRDGKGLDACAERYYLLDVRPPRGATESEEAMERLRKNLELRARTIERFGSILLIYP